MCVLKNCLIVKYDKYIEKCRVIEFFILNCLEERFKSTILEKLHKLRNTISYFRNCYECDIETLYKSQYYKCIIIKKT